MVLYTVYSTERRHNILTGSGRTAILIVYIRQYIDSKEGEPVTSWGVAGSSLLVSGFGGRTVNIMWRGGAPPSGSFGFLLAGAGLTRPPRRAI